MHNYGCNRIFFDVAHALERNTVESVVFILSMSSTNYVLDACEGKPRQYTRCMVHCVDVILKVEQVDCYTCIMMCFEYFLYTVYQ